jgi:predicted DNA binding protein
MRKLTLELEPNERVKEELKSMFEIINSFELLEIMKIDWEEGIRVDLMELHLKETQSIDKVKIIGDMEIMSVLKSEGNKHTCLAKYSEPDETKDLFKQFNLNLIYATFKKAAYQRHDILSVLTEKQREIIITAQKHGYYRYPRKIKPEELAKKIGISKGTAIEHLRKGEERIMEDIVAGH